MALSKQFHMHSCEYQHFRVETGLGGGFSPFRLGLFPSRCLACSAGGFLLAFAARRCPPMGPASPDVFFHGVPLQSITFPGGSCQLFLGSPAQPPRRNRALLHVCFQLLPLRPCLASWLGSPSVLRSRPPGKIFDMQPKRALRP